MIWTAIERQVDKELQKYAAGKARKDIEDILHSIGCKELLVIAPQEERMHANAVKKVRYHFEIKDIWKKAIKRLEAKDTLIIQFPVVNHTLFFQNVLKYAKKREVRVIAFIHDLELIRMSNVPELSLRAKWRLKYEEVNVLPLFDGIVIHNSKMKRFLNRKLGIPRDKMVALGIFDYLIDDAFVPDTDYAHYRSCIIAGNLMRSKSSYIYDLPSAPDFELYGVNFEEEYADNIHYHGSFLADELPFHLKGGFGLVWDGDSAATCSGAWGEYLRYNNPHKTSLYLACGIPVIIWKHAALADFVEKNDVGFTVDSLNNLDQAVDCLSYTDYLRYKNNAVNLSFQIRKGSFTKTALKRLGIRAAKESFR